MAHIVADRIRDTTTTTGTGAVTVSGTPPATYKTFSARMTSPSDTCAYFIAHRTADEWECGIGTYSASNTLTRTTVLSSSNSDAVVTLSAGTKDVVLTQVADRGYQTNGLTIGGDVVLNRDAANLLAQRNSTTAQTLRVYNTYTDASNYERGIFDWTTNSNVMTIGMQAAGTGAARDIRIVAGDGQSITFYTATSNPKVKFNHSGSVQIELAGLMNLGWHSSDYDFSGSVDAGIARSAAGVVEINNGTKGTITGFIQWGGQARVASDFSVTSSTALTNVTGLSVGVAAGRTYSFEAKLMVTNAAAGGVQAAIAGTATATAIQYTGYTVADNAVKGKTNATALATAVGSTVTTETAGIMVFIFGTITVNAAGTLTVQMAQNTSNGTATIAKRGSYFIVHDMP